MSIASDLAEQTEDQDLIPRAQVEALLRQALSQLTCTIAVGYELGETFVAIDHFGPTSFKSEQSKDAFCEELRQRLVAATADEGVVVRAVEMKRLSEESDVKSQISKSVARTLLNFSSPKVTGGPRHRA